MNKNQNYKLLGFDCQKDTTANVMIIGTGKVIKIEISELIKSTMSDDFSQYELKELYRKFYKRDIDTSYELTDRNERNWLMYSILASFLCMLFFVSNVTGVKTIEIAPLNMIVPFAIFIYPLTFLVVDSLNEFFGLRLARQAILLSVALNVVVYLIFWISQTAPGFDMNQDINNSYDNVISSIGFVFIASITSYFISENLNALILNHMKFREGSSRLSSRVLASTSVAAVIDSFIFIFIAFWNVFDTSTLVQMAMSQIAFKITYALIGVIPISYTRRKIDYFLKNEPVK